MARDVTISRQLAADLQGLARSSTSEICGLLFGVDGRIDGATPAPNVAVTPDTAFELDPVALFAALRAERAGGPRVIGHYHSHPTGRAEPSDRDRAAAAGDGAYWLILGDDAMTLSRSQVPGQLEPCALRLVD